MNIYGYQQAFGAADITTHRQKKAIDRWFRLYYGEGTGDPCQRIAYTLVSKLTRTVFSEYTANADNDFGKALVEALDGCRTQAVQLALVGGESFLKPVPHAGGFRFGVIPRNNVLVFGRDMEGNITDMGTVAQSSAGNRFYTLLERRRVDEQGYLTIENTLYSSGDRQNLGSQVPLTQLPEFKDLPEKFTFPQPVGSVGLVRVKTPMLNCVDGSRESVSVYAAAADLIERIDENESQLCGEFRRGQSRIVTSRDMLRDGELTDELFVGLDEDMEHVGIHIFSPELREEAYRSRKQEYLRNVESVVGLRRGMLADVNVDKRTATEVSSSDGEFNLTVIDFQRMWENAIREAARLCAILGGLYGIPGAKPVEIKPDWGNGVLHEEDKYWEQCLTMVDKGLLAPEVALGWRFNLPAGTEAERKVIRERFMPNGQCTMDNGQ